MTNGPPESPCRRQLFEILAFAEVIPILEQALGDTHDQASEFPVHPKKDRPLIDPKRSRFGTLASARLARTHFAQLYEFLRFRCMSLRYLTRIVAVVPSRAEMSLEKTFIAIQLPPTHCGSHDGYPGAKKNGAHGSSADGLAVTLLVKSEHRKGDYSRCKIPFL